ncbi:unnamed protein product, partial [Phaeothamnion confervicola]
MRTCTEVMAALCENLQPSPYPFGTMALRLLGRLGGCNRRFLGESMPVPPTEGPG